MTTHKTGPFRMIRPGEVLPNGMVAIPICRNLEDLKAVERWRRCDEAKDVTPKEGDEV